MKIAYKGFDKDLQCKGEQFVVGSTYTKEECPADKLRACTNKGWHYCNNLEDTFNYYDNMSGSNNRYCQIEILGNYKYDKYGKKGITTSFRIIRELSKDDLIKAERNKLIKRFPIKLMVKLQEKYPLFFGGSAALLLYGSNLKRNSIDPIDLDVIIPYYIKIRKKELEEIGLKVNTIDYHGAKASGNDFDETVSINFSTNGQSDEFKDELSELGHYLKLDIKVDPRQSYNFVKYNDYKLKLSQIEPIIQAKINYSNNGQEKHRDDLKDLLGIDMQNIE